MRFVGGWEGVLLGTSVGGVWRVGSMLVCLVGWLVGRLVGSLVGWLAD